MSSVKASFLPRRRPQFSPTLGAKQFAAYYWYKTEWAAICRRAGWEASGAKAELQKRVVEFLRSGKIPQSSQRAHFSQLRRNATAKVKITLATRLIPEGFKFNHAARAFFAKYDKVEKFHFIKEMAAAWRDAERRGDLEWMRCENFVRTGKPILMHADMPDEQWQVYQRGMRSGIEPSLENRRVAEFLSLR